MAGDSLSRYPVSLRYKPDLVSEGIIQSSKQTWVLGNVTYGIIVSEHVAPVVMNPVVRIMAVGSVDAHILVLCATDQTSAYRR